MSYEKELIPEVTGTVGDVVSLANSGNYDEAVMLMKESGMTSIFGDISEEMFNKAVNSITTCVCHISDVHYKTMLDLYVAEIKGDLMKTAETHRHLEVKYQMIFNAYERMVDKFDFKNSEQIDNAIRLFDRLLQEIKEMKPENSENETRENKRNIFSFFMRKKIK